MAKTKPTHFVVSAALTSSGAPAYLKADGSWTSDLTEAQPVPSKDEAQQLAVQADLEQQAVVCDPYCFPVRFEQGAIDALSARENIRAKGPSVPIRRPD
jgi:hypothetical protein